MSKTSPVVEVLLYVDIPAVVVVGCVCCCIAVAVGASCCKRSPVNGPTGWQNFVSSCQGFWKRDEERLLPENISSAGGDTGLGGAYPKDEVFVKRSEVTIERSEVTRNQVLAELPALDGC